jgi:hypothetical protein
MPHHAVAQPEILQKWVNDIPGGELHEILLLGNGKVCVCAGRSGHTSSGVECTWREFSEGKYNDIVARDLSREVLSSVRAAVQEQIALVRPWWRVWS